MSSKAEPFDADTEFQKILTDKVAAENARRFMRDNAYNLPDSKLNHKFNI
jgi:hypothetical protein